MVKRKRPEQESEAKITISVVFPTKDVEKIKRQVMDALRELGAVQSFSLNIINKGEPQDYEA